MPYFADDFVCFSDGRAEFQKSKNKNGAKSDNAHISKWSPIVKLFLPSVFKKIIQHPSSPYKIIFYSPQSFFPHLEALFHSDQIPFQRYHDLLS